MRILLLNQAFYPDHAATAQHAHDLALHLRRNGHRVSVIASRSIYGGKGSTLPRYEQHEGIEIHRVGVSLFGKANIIGRLSDFALFYILACFKAFVITRPDVVVTFSTPPFIATVGLLLKCFRRCAFVYWLMDLYPDVPVAVGMLRQRSLVTRLLEGGHRFCLKRADRVVVLGRCMQDRVRRKGIPEEKMTLIRPWADVAELSPVDKAENSLRGAWGLSEKFVVMYSGNLGLAHDAETICQAMFLLKEQDAIRFVFVGGGKGLEQVRGFAEAYGLANVQFQPYQPREQLNMSLGLADVHLISLKDVLVGLVVPSKLFGIMAAQRPAVLVGGETSEIGLILKDHQCGCVVPSGDSQELVRVILELAKSPSHCVEMGVAARQAMEQYYDRCLACEQWERLLGDCHCGSNT